MPGKRYTNKEIIEKLDEINRKTTFSSFTTLAFALFAIGVTCWGISFVGIANLDLRWLFIGGILFVFGYLVFILGFLKSRKTK